MMLYLYALHKISGNKNSFGFCFQEYCTNMRIEKFELAERGPVCQHHNHNGKLAKIWLPPVIISNYRKCNFFQFNFFKLSLNDKISKNRANVSLRPMIISSITLDVTRSTYPKPGIFRPTLPMIIWNLLIT